jgi:integrase
VHVDRLKNGVASTHTIRELRALRALRKEYPHSPYLFVTERKDPMNGPATMRKLSARAGELAKLPFPIHPHMLRHSAGTASGSS